MIKQLLRFVLRAESGVFEAMKITSTLFTAASMFAAHPASAATITFDGFDPEALEFTNYTEDGFTVNNTSSTFHATFGLGILPPSIYALNSGSASLTSGGLFTLTSFQSVAGSFDGSANYTLLGFLNGLEIYRSTYSTAQGAPTFLNPDASTAVDLVRFDVSGTVNSLDNIVVNAVAPAVPEPTTWAMMLLGFGGIGVVMRRHQKQTVRITRA
jgi:hypothetical protein